MLDKVELHKGDQKIAVENMEKLTEAMLWGAGINAAGNLVKGFMDLRTGGLTTTTTETKKFGNTTTSTSITRKKIKHEAQNEILKRAIVTGKQIGRAHV